MSPLRLLVLSPCVGSIMSFFDIHIRVITFNMVPSGLSNPPSLPHSCMSPLHAAIQHQRSSSAMSHDVFPPFLLDCACAFCSSRITCVVFAGSRDFCAWNASFGIDLLSGPACCADPATGCAVLPAGAIRPRGVMAASTSRRVRRWWMWCGGVGGVDG